MKDVISLTDLEYGKRRAAADRRVLKAQLAQAGILFVFGMAAVSAWLLALRTTLEALFGVP